VAYDEVLASRVREIAGGLAEKRMFGGLALLLAGNMAVGVIGDDLLVRVPRESFDALLAEPGARPFEMGGRVSQGWLVVAGDVLDDDVLAAWVARGVAYAESLPPK
jgi:hypothetical protein